jgi:hypothetical protein
MRQRLIHLTLLLIRECFKAQQFPELDNPAIGATENGWPVPYTGGICGAREAVLGNFRGAQPGIFESAATRKGLSGKPLGLGA